MRSAATTGLHALGLLVAVGVVFQVFFAGLGIFGAESFELHEGFGWLLHTLSIVMVVLAIAGPRTGRAIGMAVGLFVLITVMTFLPGARDDAPYLAALHPVLALFVLGLAAHIGMPIWARSRRSAV